MEFLKFHTEELPQLDEMGARYVVVAYCGEWRDGEATSDARAIPRIKRALQKRFMSRIERGMQRHLAAAVALRARAR